MRVPFIPHPLLRKGWGTQARSLTVAALIVAARSYARASVASLAGLGFRIVACFEIFGPFQGLLRIAVSPHAIEQFGDPPVISRL
jgi:hypothetical protein